MVHSSVFEQNSHLLGTHDFVQFLNEEIEAPRGLSDSPRGFILLEDLIRVCLNMRNNVSYLN